MAQNLAQRIIAEHLVEGSMEPGTMIALHIDQTLTQDATGTLVMQEFEALGVDRVRTQVSAQYVDHNLLQVDYRNADDHLFLRSACRRFGAWYSRPGNGVSHPVHMERLGVPGTTLLGSDSHTPAAGALGMLAIGAGGLDVALAMAGRPFRARMPRIRQVYLDGALPPWCSAKDIILTLLQRHGVRGQVGWIVEYDGPGLASLSAMDRHVIANMGAEMGATTSLFPSDEQTRAFLAQQGREHDFIPLQADSDASYDAAEQLDLSSIEPMIACPSSPGNVVPVREVAGRPIYQTYIGSSANPGLRDFAIPAMMVAERQIHEGVSFDINPSSRQVLLNLEHFDYLGPLIAAGGRIHQAGCNGCIGMGQAPASGRNSLRTVPRNFPGRSGTIEDAVYLCSPETATASALRGVITDPRDLDMEAPRFNEPSDIIIHEHMLEAPPADGSNIELERGPNITRMPELGPLPRRIVGPVLLRVGDDISTDDILPAGANILPYRSNIPAISRFVYAYTDDRFSHRAEERDRADFFIVGGRNYGQGSSREHAALAPRYLGLRVVVAIDFARIHAQNLVNFGILPLRFRDTSDYARIEQDDNLELDLDSNALLPGETLVLINRSRDHEYVVEHDLDERQLKEIRSGSLINRVRQELETRQNNH